MKYILYIIVLSIIPYQQNVDAKESVLGSSTRAILDAKYDAFASKEQTEAGEKASCISSVIYGLRASGYKCEYRDFKIYQRTFRRQARKLVFGKTKVSRQGLVIFNGSHFTSFYEDTNKNGVVDREDKIIHAYFHPVSITTISDWLEKDPIRPLLYIDIGKGIVCPN